MCTDFVRIYTDFNFLKNGFLRKQSGNTASYGNGSDVTEYSVEERVFLVKTYFLSNRDFYKTSTKFGKRVNMHSRKWSAKSVIQCLFRNFETTGSVLDDKRGKVGAKWSAQTPTIIGTTREMLEATPQTNLNQVAQELSVSYSTVQRIVREDLSLYPYNLQML